MENEFYEFALEQFQFIRAHAVREKDGDLYILAQNFFYEKIYPKSNWVRVAKAVLSLSAAPRSPPASPAAPLTWVSRSHWAELGTGGNVKKPHAECESVF